MNNGFMKIVSAFLGTLCLPSPGTVQHMIIISCNLFLIEV